MKNNKQRSCLLNSLKLFIALMMSQSLQVAAVEKSVELRPTSDVLTELNVKNHRDRVEAFLQKDQVVQKLSELGISKEEAKLRMAQMDDQQIQQMSQQIAEARAGGDILYVILVVVLIIFLVKRI